MPEGFHPPASRPDLEEFLSALNGFLSKQTTPGDPSNLKFLEIFFRSVKANKGHLLKITEGGILNSVVSYGMGKTFDQEFNSAHARSLGQPSPLDAAFKDQDVVAIVDLTKNSSVPSWFANLMKRYGFTSMVAVPLMGTNQPVGILCAYYEDVCLFDRATMGHLLMIGRMVGGATEQSLVANKAESHEKKEKVMDQFLTAIIGSTLSTPQVFSLLSKMVWEAMDVAGVICGLVQKTPAGLNLALLSGQGVPLSAISRNYILPRFITLEISRQEEKLLSSALALNEWGSLISLINAPSSVCLCKGIVWQNKIEGGVIAWRAPGPAFDDDDNLVLKRLVSLTAMALHVR